MAETSPNDASPASIVESGPPCRLCGVPLTTTFVDLGASPLCERFLTAAELDEMEPFYPLHVRICRNCLLVQLPEYVSPDEIFREYAYFSSFSDSWVEHARQFADTMIERLGLGPDSRVVEVASNDGYLLRHFVARGIPVLGVDPARNVAEAARAQGVPTLAEFFGVALAESLLASDGPADLIVANNVYAHVPDLHDVTGGFKVLLAPGGTISIEFPHLVRLVEGNQFDTIYHEHFSYFTLHTSSAALAAHGLRVFDVEELSSHGGSLRLFAAHEDDPRPTSERVVELLAREEALGYTTVEGHPPFAERVAATKRALAGVPRRGARGRPDDRGLRRAGQGQHAAQLLRDRARPDLVHGRPQPVQARALHAGHADPDPAARGARRRAARRRRHPALEPAARDRGPAGAAARGRHPPRRPDPERRGRRVSHGAVRPPA